MPEVYDEIASLPADMPDDLKSYITNQTQAARKQIWVSCRGENNADKESIGPFSFYPSRGFPGYYYPYKNVKGYVSPLIAVQFEKPTRKNYNYNVYGNN